MRDADLKPNRHGEETVKLSEDHLLTCLGRDGLQQELTSLTRVEMVQEAIDTRLSESRQLLVEVDKLAHGVDGIVICALNGGSSAEDVGKESCMSDFLIGHEFDERSIGGGQTGSFKVFNGECGKTPVEEVKLNPLLV